MRSSEAEWSPEQERRERESFVVLQHLYTLSDANPAESLPSGRIRDALGFSEPGFGELVEHLATVGYVTRIGGGSLLSITPAGAEYIERLAWRRRSVRAPPAEPPPLPES